MHFWINKGSQGCGFHGRYVPPSISAGSRRAGIHPKPMVTPVHRFQSIESVASGGHRHSRAPSYHTRFPAPPPSQNHHHSHDILEYHGSQTAPRSVGNPRMRRISLEQISNGQNLSLTPINGATAPTATIKCGVWMIISLIPFFIFGAKYYLNGVNFGIEAVAFGTILFVILIVGGFVSLVQAWNAKTERSSSVQISSEHNETFEDSSQVPTNITPIHAELPPPPYHIAVMLPTQNEHITVIQDSPPPTYDKAVT